MGIEDVHLSISVYVHAPNSRKSVVGIFKASDPKLFLPREPRQDVYIDALGRRFRLILCASDERDGECQARDRHPRRYHYR